MTCSSRRHELLTEIYQKRLNAIFTHAIGTPLGLPRPPGFAIRIAESTVLTRRRGRSMQRKELVAVAWLDSAAAVNGSSASGIGTALS
jgi:DNA-directed RNA polymerase specialized sigma24 family protein